MEHNMTSNSGPHQFILAMVFAETCGCQCGHIIVSLQILLSVLQGNPRVVQPTPEQQKAAADHEDKALESCRAEFIYMQRWVTWLLRLLC